MAWIITRTNVPGRRFFEQVMVVPYYLTPLLGALAWSLLGTPRAASSTRSTARSAAPSTSSTSTRPTVSPG
jgi:ABC-type Fe3+ transport system permease subunit